jgi:hypothetical protein
MSDTQYAVYKEVEIWVRETSPVTKGGAAYLEFTRWVRARGVTECRSMSTFSCYYSKARRQTA